MTVDLRNLEYGDIALLRSGHLMQVTVVTIDDIDDADYPVNATECGGRVECYMLDGRTWEEKEHPGDIVRIIKNPKGLDLVDLVCEAFK